MIELLTAVKTAYTANETKANALRALNTGGLWPGRAPKKTAPPYIDYHVPNMPSSYLMPTTEFNEPDVEFHIWTADDTPSPLNVLTIAASLRALFQDNLLTLTNGWAVIRADIRNQILMKDETDDGWHEVVIFHYEIGRKGTA